MGILGDTLDEFKRAKTPEKVFIVGGAIAVVAIALYVHKQSSVNNPAQGATPTSGGGTSSGGIQTVPTSSGGSVPILPTGLCPIYDQQGNLQGYQPCSSGGGTTTPTPIPTSANSPLIPYSTFAGGKFPTIAGKPYANVKQYTYGGTTYNVNPGTGGNIWGTPVGGGKQILLYGPIGAYPKQGGGPYGTRVLGHHGSRIAPTRESKRQSTTASRVYAMRNR